ncbi:LuxR C-terminal-related transcriptional regulator [Rhizobium sp. S152]|uniref:LuxR C-terminal-related transcriptional regulator n=1 Tax=Rhizobium sp. S152 TaxID=3055038 RepID=UPI0025A9B12D|nr:LuxR C-terminal-related transcriptional regulator [Rhizobium sp. S152]MDM9625219.1 LuxR C-terminal-related transcriptional regulator [Rhizobium sp. S152]
MRQQEPTLSDAGKKPLPQRLRPPRMLFQAIERPYLLSKIYEGLARQIVVMHAPAGFGKTALLRESYVSLTRSHSEIEAILGGRIGHRGWLTVMPCRTEETVLADLVSALDIDAAFSITTLSDLMDAIALRSDLTILFVDQIDACTSHAVAELFSELMLTAPDTLRVVCATQSTRHLPIARLGVRGVVLEITAQQLAFTRSEIRNAFGRNLGTADVDSLAKSTRGWPAIVQGARIALDTIDREERAALLEGTHRTLLNYVDEVILSGLSAPLRRALRACCITEEFSFDLATHLTGLFFTPVDAETLDDLFPLLDRGTSGYGWYRFHPILRSSLAAELAGEPQTDEGALHSCAAEWFTSHGMLEKGVSHAAHGGNFALAADTICQAGGVNLFIRAGHTVLEHLIHDLPASIIHASPSLSLCYVLVLAKKGSLSAARECLEAIKQGRADRREEFLKIDPITLNHIDGLVNVYEDRHLDDSDIADLETLAAGFTPQCTWELGWIHNHLCIAYTRRGDLDLARLSALKALNHYRDERTAYSQIFMLIHLGLVHCLSGNFAAALSFCREGQDLIQSAQWTDRNLSAICEVATADILYLQGDISLVEKSLSTAITPIIRGEGWIDIFTRLFSLLARARLRLFGIDVALAAVDKAEEVAIERGLPRLKLAAEIMRGDLFSKANMVEPAVLLCDRLISDRAAAAKNIGSWTWRERNDFDLVLARLLLLQKRPTDAFVALEAVIDRCRRRNEGYHLLTAEILATQAAWNAGKHVHALEMFQASIARARAHEATQPFIDEGTEFATVVRAIIRRFGLKVFSVDAVDFINRMVGQRVRGSTGRSQQNGFSKSALTEKLTAGVLSKREQEVLLELHDGKSNKEIARTLGLSDATVKFHLKNIFSKLGVSRRAMALVVSDRLKLH